MVLYITDLDLHLQVCSEHILLLTLPRASHVFSELPQAILYILKRVKSLILQKSWQTESSPQ